MKFLILFLLVLNIGSLSANDHCQKYHFEKDLKLYGAKDKFIHCSLDWEKGGIQFVQISKGCIEDDGGKLRDCALIRTCPSVKEEASERSVTLFDFKSGMESTLCLNQRLEYELFKGEDGSLGIINCKKGKITDVKLISPSKKEKKCVIH